MRAELLHTYATAAAAATTTTTTVHIPALGHGVDAWHGMACFFVEEKIGATDIPLSYAFLHTITSSYLQGVTRIGPDIAQLAYFVCMGGLISTVRYVHRER